MAAFDLLPGSAITEGDIELISVPKKYVPEGACIDPELVEGRVPYERILDGEFILSKRLADGWEGIGTNALVPPGMRGFSLTPTESGYAANFLIPGEEVDVLVTLPSPESGHKGETLTLFERILVIAVTEIVRREGGRRLAAHSAVLALTPREAEIVTHAGRLGAVTIAIRPDSVPTGGRFEWIPSRFSRKEVLSDPIEPVTDRTVLKILKGE